MNEKTKTIAIWTLLLIVILAVGLFSYKYIYLDYKSHKESSKKIINNNVPFTSHLPVVVINTDGNLIDREKVKGNMNIYDNVSGENTITEKSRLKTNIEIKARGRSSYSFPKKQYLIDTVKEDGSSKNYSIMGMPREGEWVLNGPYADKSLIRNYLVYTTASKIMDYAPRVRFCEVFIKTSKGVGVTMNDYKGLYIMVESVNVGKDRVNISQKMKGVDATGYIVARNKLGEKDVPISTYTMDIKRGNPLIIEYPKGNNLTEGRRVYIEDDIDHIEKRMYSMMYADEKHGYRNYIDIDSFVDYVIINEFFFNVDGGNLSVYLHKEPGSKLKAGPIWDFNISMGNFKESKDHKYLRMIDYPWFERLLTDRYFLDKVSKRYLELRGTYLNEEYILNSIDKAIVHIGPAKDRNFKIWPQVFLKETWPNPENPRTSTYEDEISMMKGFIKEHGRWMDEYFTSRKYLELATSIKQK
ncbi:MAG: CotH kinase family protein [Clostridium sp.]